MLNMGYRQLSVVLLVVFLCKFSFSSTLCPIDQSISLLKFKETLTIDPTRSWCYPKTVSWNMSRDCCIWDGVKCDELSGHVIELDLSCSQLKGKIDSNNSLFQLSHLQRLNLSMNDFSDSHISPAFGRLLSLTHLDLSSSSFSGQIPSEISHLSKLQYFRIYSGDLRLVARDFKLLLKNLTQLKELDLSNVNISSTIPPNFSSHITILKLGSTGLHGIIPESIFHLPNLEVLDLRSNAQLSGYFPKTKWNSSASLIKLDLSRVNFSSNFPESLSYLTSLHHLSLRDCNLWGPIPESLSNLTRIEYLDLGDNSLNGTIPSWILSYSSLNRLDLKNNHFSGQLDDFKYNTLVWINLKGNQLQGHLPKSIQNLVNLEVLDLSSNNFSGQVDVSYFSNHNQLTDLDLSYNRISLTNENEVKLSLPKSLFRLLLVACEVKELEFLRSAKRLKTLDLSYNKIQGRIPNWAWSNWMFSLEYLDLSHNMLESVDSIPPESYVYWIDLRSNFLQGPLPIPPNFIEYFFISNNNLSGEIPSSVCTVTSLRVLDLARNNLEGAIPQCLGNMSRQLEVLDMQRNSLSGDLQMTFSFQNGLKSFNLHGNKLEGKLPRSLVNCQHLEVLDLGDNHFNDMFPMWLGTLPKLQVLSLRSNKLHGAIRTSRINLFPQLRIVDLSGNAFSAELPTSLFKHLKAMRRIDHSMKEPIDGYYQDSVTLVTKGLQFEVVRILSLYTTIDLSNNKFEGHIPSVLGDLISLRVLNLSHNGLQGHIPSSLGNLSVVESLDLSLNQLAGKIPEQLASQLTSLAVLNLSHNYLEGCIPRGPQFATFQQNSYEGNDGLRGFPISKGCGNDRVSETNNTVSALDDQESNSEFLNDFWKAALMGYGSGLCIGLSIIYFMISSGNLKWLARIIEGMEHRIITRRKKKQRGQRHYRRRNNNRF
ncbi:receptor-like protein Cf-9 homolog [Nicotiana tabacum]|uniref:Receptor-like protein 12 n=1 Tax=Nicotiana tabacum TaxID=4097 RepID=A0A1S3ZVQ5_TOBAC|nr:PREDICTED: receptor-like protein 12 [Nicotiana tabacum]